MEGSADSASHGDPLEEDLEDYDLGGETGGEQDVRSDDPFFVSKQAAAVFKHKILKVYFPKFAGKAGSTEPDKRLVYVDTHAGRGSYDDGTPGSPLLIARNVAAMSQRQIECLFIEARKGNHRHLKTILEREMPSTARWEALYGTASGQLNEALAYAGDSPLFMFIDPYGLGPTFPEVIRILNRRRKGFGSKTEVLLNFISGAFARAGGYLRLSPLTPQQHKTLEHLDEVLNGPWWRQVYLSAATPSDAVEQIAVEFAKRVERSTGCRSTLIPVKNRAHHVPLYWLLHFTRHPDGVWWIREAASQASAEWRRYCNPPPPEDDGLFPLEDEFPEEEARREAVWVDQIESNARSLLTHNGVVNVPLDATALFGNTLGLAWSKHLRQALARLYADGRLEPKPMSDRLDKYVGTAVAARGVPSSG
ncbi:MAG TPA: three-Cys-motif partner protein TcmP [Kribbella sp.]|uniref:three-Cys-motif partner protein TcmP n=1 Tax=Kribbella sp. TaxID=1871183 RepID=UPI002D779BB5|nr:three-Cys-motif partner protein TcmP [Kribbella sp.]HET6292232.1 three-Cys-motif partner protein TcmP [Kribbella sp.]